LDVIQIVALSDWRKKHKIVEIKMQGYPINSGWPIDYRPVWHRFGICYQNHNFWNQPL